MYFLDMLAFISLFLCLFIMIAIALLWRLSLLINLSYLLEVPRKFFVLEPDIVQQLSAFN